MHNPDRASRNRGAFDEAVKENSVRASNGVAESQRTAQTSEHYECRGDIVDSFVKRTKMPALLSLRLGTMVHTLREISLTGRLAEVILDDYSVAATLEPDTF